MTAVEIGEWVDLIQSVTLLILGLALIAHFTRHR